MNPDNVATPIAASLGDVTTLGLLAWIADILYNDLEKELFPAHIIIGNILVILVRAREIYRRIERERESYTYFSVSSVKSIE